MDAAALLALFRADVRDDVAPYLWSDIEVLSYIDDAQKMFCRLQGGILDSTSPLTVLTVTIGVANVPYDPRILKVKGAWRESDGCVIEILNFEDLQFKPVTNDYGYRLPPQIDNTPGPIKALVTGMDDTSFRIVHVPIEADIVHLTVLRLPLKTISEAELTLEIAEQHHRHLLLWVKHLAHLKQDAETYDRGRAEQFRSEFLAYCDMAKGERERRDHKPRTVAYGGY